MILLFFVVLLSALGVKIPRKWRNNPIDMALYCKICHHIVFETKTLVAPYETRTVKQCSKIGGEEHREECLKPAWNDEGVILEAMENVCSIPFPGYTTKKNNLIPRRLLLGQIHSSKLQKYESLSDEEMSLSPELREKTKAMCANLDEDLQEVILHTFQTGDEDLINTICQREIGENCGSTAGFTEKSLYAIHPKFLTKAATELPDQSGE